MTETVLFVCIGNSCRSQMAEGFLNSLRGDQFQAYSAGIRPSKLDPLAVQVMREADIDISGNDAKTLDSYPELIFDYVVTVCDAGAAECPYIPAGKKNIHHEFPDPPKITANMTDSEEKLPVYRGVRDSIRAFVMSFPES